MKQSGVQVLATGYLKKFEYIFPAKVEIDLHADPEAAEEGPGRARKILNEWLFSFGSIFNEFTFLTILPFYCYRDVKVISQSL